MPAPIPLSRRRLLGLGIGLPFLAGCTLSNPTIEEPARTASSVATSAPPSPSPAPRPTPRSNARARQAATTELALAALARAIVTGPHQRSLSGDQRALLNFLVRAHQAHGSAFDADVRTGPPPNIGRLTLSQSLTRLASNETAAAARHRASALAIQGRDAARLGAAAIAARLYAQVIAKIRHVPVAGPATAPGLPLGSDVAAVQSLVAQLHAVVYGYQLAIGRLPVLGGRHDQAVAELLQLRIQRERLISWLVHRSAAVPPAEPAYRPTVEPRDPASAAKLIRTMLVALQPFDAIWLAAAGNADREWAFTTFGTIVELARAWNAPLPIWPGGFG